MLIPYISSEYSLDKAFREKKISLGRLLGYYFKNPLRQHDYP